ncbi:MAG: energy-coupling factor transporter transmembrane protein EcfT [Desulfobacteraceae bacterium]|nr:energy-coupling factor transporter transmembrane protein EcfT [Desulfobacteraceae bacterium]
MAELTSLSFRPGNSVLHELDVRFKLVFLILVSLATLNGHLAELFALIFTACVLIAYIRLPLLSVFKEIRYFFFLLVFVFWARALSTPGVPVIETGFFEDSWFAFTITVSRQGLYTGFVVCFRLLLIALLGVLFVSTTRTSAIKSAVEWFLAPFPFIPHKRTATMISLLVRFIPVILEQAGETSDALRARGIENRKNPVYRMVKIGIPLMRRTFDCADKLVTAMEARCYSENRTDPELLSKKCDWVALFVGVCLTVILVID